MVASLTLLKHLSFTVVTELLQVPYLSFIWSTEQNVPRHCEASLKAASCCAWPSAVDHPSLSCTFPSVMCSWYLNIVHTWSFFNSFWRDHLKTVWARLDIGTAQSHRSVLLPSFIPTAWRWYPFPLPREIWALNLFLLLSSIYLMACGTSESRSLSSVRDTRPWQSKKHECFPPNDELSAKGQVKGS